MPLVALEPRESAADACARSLRAVVLQGELSVGERLPPERALAQTLGVNRVTVRSALAQLVAEGLLTVRQGSGYVVRDWLETAGPELLVALARESDVAAQRELVRDVLEVRRAVARVVLERLANEQAGPHSLARIEAAVDAMEAKVRAGAPLREIAEADLQVLAEVVAATGSRALRLMLNPVAAVLRATPMLVEAMFSDPGQNVVSWRMLRGWMEKPTVESVSIVLDALAAHDEATLSALRRKS